jgi:hypothetical protein
MRDRKSENEVVPAWALEVVAALRPLSYEEEVAELLRVHPKTIARKRRAGQIQALKTAEKGSGRVLYARREVARLVARLA